MASPRVRAGERKGTRTFVVYKTRSTTQLATGDWNHRRRHRPDLSKSIFLFRPNARRPGNDAGPLAPSAILRGRLATSGVRRELQVTYSADAGRDVWKLSLVILNMNTRKACDKDRGSTVDWWEEFLNTFFRHQLVSSSWKNIYRPFQICKNSLQYIFYITYEEKSRYIALRLLSILKVSY